MPDSAHPAPTRHRSRVLATLRALVRARITTGLITILPVVVTVWLVMLVFRWLRDASLWILDAFVLSAWGRKIMLSWGIPPEDMTSVGMKSLPTGLQWGISIFSVILTILILYTIGLFAANLLGRRLIEWSDQFIARVPFIKTIYGALKQILGMFSADQAPGFQRVALVPFPNELTRSVGFITNTYKDSVTGEDLVAVFVATTPNPTTGYLFILKRKDIIEVDWTVEEAIKICMSGGILSPSYVTMATGQHRAPLPPSADSPTSSVSGPRATPG
jgi:uncharacterized membrane protein